MNAEARFKRTVRKLHSDGVYPTPTVLNRILHGTKSSNLGGEQPRWRREVMAELGVPLMRRPRAARARRRRR
jgi:hypothetical protein